MSPVERAVIRRIQPTIFRARSVAEGFRGGLAFATSFAVKFVAPFASEAQYSNPELLGYVLDSSPWLPGYVQSPKSWVVWIRLRQRILVFCLL